MLEPDADRDGYGDLTQDLCPSSATTHGSCPLPETSLTKKPKKQVHKRATVFKFASSLPGSRFECSVDHATFKPCTSPFRKKFRPGKHTFEVRAVDAAGNVDPTPAKVRWRFVPVG